MILGGIPYANGLPSSEEQPAMKGLKPLESAILHKLTGNWGPHVERSISMPSAGWNTIVDEEVFSGPLIYDTFPWDYDKDRPLLKDKTEKRQHLTTKQWKTADIDFVRPDDFLKPFLKCHICKKNHARELWQYYHPTRISPVKFQMWSKSG